MITRADLVEAVRSCDELQALAAVWAYARRSLDDEAGLGTEPEDGSSITDRRCG